jgi:hypothetical protein
MLPNFLGIGAQRAGTSWLARNLMQHPQVYLPHAKELHFFDRHYEEGVAYYEHEFAGWAGQPAVGEVTPRYLHDERAAARIKELLPNARLIVSLRHPVDRAYSSYWKSKATFPDPNDASFEEKLESNPEIIRVGMYYEHLTRYLKLFPREQLHISLFDDINSHPAALLREVFAFLKIDETFVPSVINDRINAGASQGNLAKSRWLWYLYRGLRRLGYTSLAKKVEQQNRAELPPMRPETRKKLFEIYRGQVDQLSTLIDRDLSCWGF